MLSWNTVDVCDFFSVAAVAAAVDALSYSLRIHSLNCLRVLNICVFVSFLSPLHDLHPNQTSECEKTRKQTQRRDIRLDFDIFFLPLRRSWYNSVALYFISAVVVCCIIFCVCVFFFLQVFPSYFVRSIFSFWFVLIVCVCMWLFWLFNYRASCAIQNRLKCNVNGIERQRCLFFHLLLSITRNNKIFGMNHSIYFTSKARWNLKKKNGEKKVYWVKYWEKGWKERGNHMKNRSARKQIRQTILIGQIWWKIRRGRKTLKPEFDYCWNDLEVNRQYRVFCLWCWLRASFARKLCTIIRLQYWPNG